MGNEEPIYTKQAEDSEASRGRTLFNSSLPSRKNEPVIEAVRIVDQGTRGLCSVPIPPGEWRHVRERCVCVANIKEFGLGFLGLICLSHLFFVIFLL